MNPTVPMYGRREARLRDGQQSAAYGGETYYERPALKPSHYGWLITSYLFVGGVAGASQIIAAIADMFGGADDRGVVRGGRYLALLGALLSPVFLIRDLHTPKRFYNMMRIFRPTSPMSIGSWTLAAFGTFSGLAAAGQLLHDLTGSALARWLARLAGVPAAGAGVLMSCYTGSLLSATSVPLWSSVWRLLPPLFGSSAMSTGSAATSLALQATGASEQTHVSMERIALAASAAELALTLACDRKWSASKLDEPLKSDPKLATAYRVGVLGFGVLMPLAIHALHVLTGKRWAWLSHLADASALAGGFTQRAVLTFAGNRSAERPRDYFRITQP
ncbi:MAG TPA: NrfD/PsrC family molybdoenzyme membrane anchor subunit [Chloroflexota bacterium]|nr:NrfD/PsrC family molybdoenzyme membrane anchor subunit [Chloroflexota bacterium]